LKSKSLHAVLNAINTTLTSVNDVYYVTSRCPYRLCSSVFQSHVFHPCQPGAAFSSPALSTHAIWSCVFRSHVFHPCDLVPHFPVPHFQSPQFVVLVCLNCYFKGCVCMQVTITLVRLLFGQWRQSVMKMPKMMRMSPSRSARWTTTLVCVGDINKTFFKIKTFLNTKTFEAASNV